jgi:hypothetical protein
MLQFENIIKLMMHFLSILIEIAFREVLPWKFVFTLQFVEFIVRGWKTQKKYSHVTWPYFPIGTLGTCLGRKDLRGGKFLKLTLHILSSTRLNRKSYFNDETISNIIVELRTLFNFDVNIN